MHWSHNRAYPHLVNLDWAEVNLVHAVAWCNQQWGNSDRILFHKPGKMGLKASGYHNGWYHFNQQFHFANADHAMMFKLAHG